MGKNMKEPETKRTLCVIVSSGDPAQDLRDLADNVANEHDVPLDKKKHIAILLHCADLVDELRRDLANDDGALESFRMTPVKSNWRPRFPNKVKPFCDNYCKDKE